MSAPSDRDHQVAVCVDFHRVAGLEHRGGGVFFDERRAGDGVTRLQRRAAIGAAFSPTLARDAAAAFTGHGFRGRRGLAASELGRAWVLHPAGDGAAEVYDLHRLLRRAATVALVV